MAEFVEKRLEEMIPELEQLERIELFKKEEIRAIIKKRREFEYKIQKKFKCKTDYLRYIQYEMNLLSLVYLRRKKFQNWHKWKEIDYSIRVHIKRLFQIVTTRFKNDLKLWLSYIDFLKQVKWNMSLREVFVKLLKIHSNRPDLWVLAAKWEVQTNDSVENARNHLLQGLRHHPHSKELYLEGFRLELLYVAKLHERQKVLGITKLDEISEESADKVMEGEAAGIIYRFAIEKIPEPDVIVSFLSVAKLFDFTQKLQETLIRDLQEKFPNDELTWDTLARMALEGKSTKSDSEEKGTLSLKHRIQNCCNVYKNAVKAVKTEKMWSLYLDTLLELLQVDNRHHNQKKKCLIETMQCAEECGLLQEKYYLKWIQTLWCSRNVDQLEITLQTATEKYPRSSALWQEYVKFYICSGDYDTAYDIFLTSLKQLQDTQEELHMWQLMMKALELNPKDSRKLFERGLKESPVIVALLKTMYLESTACYLGIQAARGIYETYAGCPPFSHKFHQLMVKLECSQTNIDIDQVRRVHELACDQFGKSQTDVWMQYINFELKHGSSLAPVGIYWRARKTLDPLLVEQFVSEFELQKIAEGIHNNDINTYNSSESKTSYLTT